MSVDEEDESIPAPAPVQVREDGSGDEAALLVMRRVRRRERDPYVAAQRRENLHAHQAAEGRRTW